MHVTQKAVATRSHHVGSQIKDARAARGMTQRQLADAVGQPVMRISRLELGKVRLRVEDLPAYAQALGIAVGSLIEPLPTRRRRRARATAA